MVPSTKCFLISACNTRRFISGPISHIPVSPRVSFLKVTALCCQDSNARVNRWNGNCECMWFWDLRPYSIERDVYVGKRSDTWTTLSRNAFVFMFSLVSSSQPHGCVHAVCLSHIAGSFSLLWVQPLTLTSGFPHFLLKSCSGVTVHQLSKPWMPVCEQVCNRSRSCPSRSREQRSHQERKRGAGEERCTLCPEWGPPSALLGLEFTVREHTITQRLKSKSWAGDLKGSPALDIEVSFGSFTPEHKVMWTRDRDGNSHFHSFHPSVIQSQSTLLFSTDAHTTRS